MKKNLVIDKSISSPLRTAQEYAEDERDKEIGEEDVGTQKRDEVLEAIVRRPTVPKPPIQGNGSTSIDSAMEYFLSTALVNSAKFATFDGLKISTKFGDVTVSKPKEQKVLQPEVPQVPVEEPEEGIQ